MRRPSIVLILLVALSGCLGAPPEEPPETPEPTVHWFDLLPPADDIITDGEVVADPVALGLDGAVRGYAIRFLEDQEVAEAGYSVMSDQATHEGPEAPCVDLIRAVPAPPEAFGHEGEMPPTSQASWGRTAQVGTNTRADLALYAAGGEVIESSGASFGTGLTGMIAGSTDYDEPIEVKAGHVALLIVGADGLAALQADSEQASIAKLRPTGTFQVALAWERPMACGNALPQQEHGAHVGPFEVSAGSSFEMTTHNGTGIWLVGGAGLGQATVTFEGQSQDFQWGPQPTFLVDAELPKGTDIGFDFHLIAGTPATWMVRDTHDWHPEQWF